MATSSLGSKQLVSVWDKGYEYTINGGDNKVFTCTCPKNYNGLRRISVTIETNCDLITSGFREEGDYLRVSIHNFHTAAQTVYIFVHAVYSNCSFVQITNS